MSLKVSSRRVRLACLVALAALAVLPAHAQLDGPPRAELMPLVAADGVRVGDDLRAALHVRLPAGLHVNAHAPRDPSLIPLVLSVDPPAGVSVEEVVYPDATELIQLDVEQPLLVYEREFAIGLRLRIAGDARPGMLTVPARLRYQACDERVCYLPVTTPVVWSVRIAGPSNAVSAINTAVFERIPFGTGERPPAPSPETLPAPAAAQADGDDPVLLLERFTVAGTTGGYLGREDFLAFMQAAESGVPERGWFEGRGVLAVVVLVLAGGLALNLTPCVLPMIPINLAIIGAGTQARSRRRGLLLGAAYGAAMAVTYGVLGLLVILTAGTFGTINASPWFNVAIAAVFVVLALAMLDVVSIDFSRFSTRFTASAAGRGTFVVAFGMGTVAALLAGACVAPVVIQVILFSSNLYASGMTAALALPFLLGVGMAVPWPLAGAGLAALPKPGAWMVRVKQGFGVVILATAVYYGYLGFTLFADRWVDPAEVSASVEAKLKEGWYGSLAAGLAAAEQEGKPVLVDLWATWCKNCLAMDRTTLADPQVTAAAEGYVRIKFQAEDPDDPVVKAVMQRVGAIGLPTYVVLKPRI